jgi:purine-binding chemotaxis protein CheW
MSIYDQFSENELEVLLARARRLAGAAATIQDRSAQDVALLVSIRKETYALPLVSLTAVYQDLPVVAVPCAPAHIAGITNIRGRVIPVVDLAALLGVPGEVSSEGSALVVMSTEEMTLAFRVDAIGDVLPLVENDLTPIPTTFGLTKSDYLQGVLPNGTVLLNVGAVLQDPALTVDETVN